MNSAILRGRRAFSARNCISARVSGLYLSPNMPAWASASRTLPPSSFRRASSSTAAIRSAVMSTSCRAPASMAWRILATCGAAIMSARLMLRWLSSKLSVNRCSTGESP